MVRMRCSLNNFYFHVFLTVGAQACAIVFSTVDRDSFDAVEKWRSKVCHLGLLCSGEFAELLNHYNSGDLSVVNLLGKGKEKIHTVGITCDHCRALMEKNGKKILLCLID